MDLVELWLTQAARTLASVALPEPLIAAIVSAVATLALVAGFRPRLAMPGRAARNPVPEENPDSCDFLINGGTVRALTAPARALIDEIGRGKPSIAALKKHLEADCPSIHRDIDALVIDGVGFRHHCPRADGTAAEILGEPRGNEAVLSIRPASEDARALQDTRTSLERATGEIGFLQRVINRAPVFAWTIAPDGHVTWANEQYRARFDPTGEALPGHRIPNAFSHVMESVPLTSRGAEHRTRMLVPSASDTEPQWYEVSEIEESTGERLGYALETNELVAAEASLRRFVETLTETFAHLPIGLAVFDKNRRLGLFNPALTKLVKIDAVWLAGRPSLRDFLERLRETRQMPEQKDFAAWRRKLTELEEGARHGTYEENWVLPSGKVLRVNGRPHPQGALAFLFEDISASITLERKYRSELELSQATLDKLGEAVAVFNASGSLVFVNTAFEELWGLDPMESLEGPTIGDVARVWAKKCAPSPVWSNMSEFATAADARGSWSETVDMLDGRKLRILMAPLPDASALVVFRDLTASMQGEGSDMEYGNAILSEFALEQIRGPAESAMKEVLSALPATEGAEEFQNLSHALRDLRDGISRSVEFREIARNATRAQNRPLPALAAALHERGLVLEAPAEASQWSARIRSAATALGIAAADEAAAGSAVRIALTPNGGGLDLSVTATAGDDPPREHRLGVDIARRIVGSAGGEIEIRAAEGEFVLLAHLPPALAAGAPPALPPESGLALGA